MLQDNRLAPNFFSSLVVSLNYIGIEQPSSLSDYKKGVMKLVETPVIVFAQFPGPFTTTPPAIPIAFLPLCMPTCPLIHLLSASPQIWLLYWASIPYHRQIHRQGGNLAHLQPPPLYLPPAALSGCLPFSPPIILSDILLAPSPAALSTHLSFFLPFSSEWQWGSSM